MPIPPFIQTSAIEDLFPGVIILSAHKGLNLLWESLLCSLLTPLKMDDLPSV
jgi:hypothetical protein